MIASSSLAAAASPSKQLPPATTVAPIEAPRRGVVVIGAGSDVEASTWPVALAIYGELALRPKVADAEARVLAGSPPPANASKDLVELAELRAKIVGDDVASRAMLKEIARRTRTLAIVVVTTTGDATEARVYDAADDRLESTRHRAESKDWSPLVVVLRGRYGKTTSEPAVAPTPKDPPKSRSFYESPWFWGAVGAAVVGGVAAWAITRNDEKAPPPVRIEWGAR